MKHRMKFLLGVCIIVTIASMQWGYANSNPPFPFVNAPDVVGIKGHRVPYFRTFQSPEFDPPWIWRLKAETDSGWRHIQGTQTPLTWNAVDFSERVGYWKRLVLSHEDSWRHFQGEAFHGKIRPVGPGDCGVATEYSFDITAKTDQDYFLVPTTKVVSAGQEVTITARRPGTPPGEDPEVESTWEISSLEGISPTNVWENSPDYDDYKNATVTFSSEEPGLFTVTGKSTSSDPEDPTYGESDSAVVTVFDVILTIDGVDFRSHENGENDKVVVLINDGFDEGNTDVEGAAVPDNQPDATEGHRIAGSEAPIVSGSARIEGLAEMPNGLEGSWTLTYDNNIMIWVSNGNGGFDRVVSGEQGARVPVNEAFEFLIEGVERSGAMGDVIVTATFALDEQAQNALHLDGDIEVAGDLTVAGISSVVWAEIDSPLTANAYPEQDAAIGFRIFPGKQTPDDEVARNTVLVVATVEPGTDEIAQAVADKGGVRFKSFDVNDPSANEAPVDPTGNAGETNRGTPREGTLDAENNPADVVFVNGSAVATNVSGGPGKRSQ